MGKPSVNSKGLQIGAHRIKNTDEAWWYEEYHGIAVAFSPPGSNGHCILIPWRSLKLAIRRRFKTEEHAIITPRKQFARFVGYVKTYWTYFVRRRGIAPR